MRIQNTTHGFSNPCPVGFVWIARTINVCYNGLLGTTVEFRAAHVLIFAATLGPQPAGPDTRLVDGYFGIDAGEQFEVKSLAQAQGIDVYVTGYELLLP